MRISLVAGLLALALSTSGCSIYLDQLPGPDVTLRNDGSGNIRASINPNYSDWPIVLTGVEMEQKNNFGRFVTAGGSLTIPCDRGSIELRNNPHGRAISGEAWLDWDVPSLRRRWEFYPTSSNWEFTVDSNHDGGSHILTVEVRIQNPGQRGYIQRSTVWISCPQRCER